MPHHRPPIAGRGWGGWEGGRGLVEYVSAAPGKVSPAVPPLSPSSVPVLGTPETAGVM